MITKRTIKVTLLALALGLVSVAEAQLQLGRVHGRGRFEKVKGKPAMGYQELYETNLFLVRDTGSNGNASRRLGTTYYSGSSCVTNTVGGGVYCIDADTGACSMFMNEPLFFIRPTVVSGVNVPSGFGTIEFNVEVPIDFSTYFQNTGQWTSGAPTWYQTYTAEGTSVTGVSFVLAGTTASSANVAILQSNGSPNDVLNWTVIASKIEPNIGSNTDNWVRWRSGEVPTIPGVQYAVRITGTNGNIQPYKRNKDGSSYVGGQAFDQNGNPQSFDLNYVVFADNDGTMVTMNKRTTGNGELKSPNYWSTKWGQTFTAQGTSLAGADVKASGTNNVWQIDFDWRIYPANAGGIAGPQIGATKTTKSAWEPFAFHQAVAYTPGQIPLTPGQQYFIEFEANDPPPESYGFNPWIMDNDSYDGGQGWWWDDGGGFYVSRPFDDVNMTIVEYAPSGPEIQLNTTSLTRDVFLGDGLANDVFTVTNVGDDTLNYTVTDDAGWLSVNPIDGSSTGEPHNISVIYGGVSNFACGTYNATIEVAGNAYNSPQQVAVTVTVYSVPPDVDCDCDVDQADFGKFQECFTGPGVSITNPECEVFDFDGQDDVDQADFSIFQACHSGANICADRDCANP